MTVAFLNGSFFGGPSDPGGGEPLARAVVSAFDAGVQHGVGLFETMLGGVTVRGIEGATTHGEEAEGWVLQMDEHLGRLAESARVLGLSDQLRTGALGEAVLETVRRSRLARARIRLTITGGDLSLLASAQSPGDGEPRGVDPTVLIVAQPTTRYPAAMFDRGVGVTLADARANPLNPFEGHKTLNYWWRLRELQGAAKKGAGEALVLSVTNHICGGCVSNIVLVKGEEAVTPIARGEEAGTQAQGEMLEARARPTAPALPSPVLPGITRAWALERLERSGLRIRKRMVSVQDLMDADEVMLTNSSWGVLPVVRVEASVIGVENGDGEGAPGTVTRGLIDSWRSLFPRSAAG